jgi:hypothetical protein
VLLHWFSTRFSGFAQVCAAYQRGPRVQEIESLRRGLTREMRMEPHPYPYLKVGHRVRVRTGPLQGLQGILVRKSTGNAVASAKIAPLTIVVTTSCRSSLFDRGRDRSAPSLREPFVT